MSAFLGPIHIKMYDKILYQDEMAESILLLAEQHGWLKGLREQVDAKAPPALRQPLESIVDTGNIHGWIGAAVTNCEKRFAYIVCSLLENHPERLEQLEAALGELGRKAALPGGLEADRAFGAVHDILLDGMPCDFPYEVLSSGSEAVMWHVNQCPHAPYWQRGGCNAQTYYLLRDAWIDGALEKTGITYSRDEQGNAGFERGGQK